MTTKDDAERIAQVQRSDVGPVLIVAGVRCAVADEAEFLADVVNKNVSALIASAVLAARTEAFEEAAKIAEYYFPEGGGDSWEGFPAYQLPEEISAAIRAAPKKETIPSAAPSDAWRPDPAALLRFAARKLRARSHHCFWLSLVGYRQDPLDQALVDGLLKGVALSLEELALRPERTRAMMEGWLERQADHAEEG
jgi:hypothetical protein